MSTEIVRIDVASSAHAAVDAAPASRDVSQCLTSADDHNDEDGEILNDRQRLAVELILSGKTDTAVASAIGVSRRTITRWRHEDAEFISELQQRRRRLWCSA